MKRFTDAAVALALFALGAGVVLPALARYTRLASTPLTIDVPPRD
jgi:hypothetical protein